MAFDTTTSTLDPTARPDLDIARSWLLTPATPDQPELIGVALRSDADAVILDLEDSRKRLQAGSADLVSTVAAPRRSSPGRRRASAGRTAVPASAFRVDFVS